MKIGIPSFLLTIIVLFLLCVSVFAYVTFFELSHIEEFPNKKTIGFLVLYSIGPIGLFFLSKYLKIILLKESSFVVIQPLRFKTEKHQYSDIIKVEWGIIDGVGKGPDGLGLELFLKSKKIFSISDYEFENYSVLEKLILDKSNTNPPYNKRSKLKIKQAKSNLFFCALGLCLFGILSMNLLNSIENGFSSKFSYLSIIPFFIFIRISIHTFNYIKVIRNDA